VIAGVIWLIHRKRVASDGLTPIERKELEYPDREILAMLRQHGGPMAQREVIDSLPGELADIARVMNAMESKELIQRKWRSDPETYIVTA
jgi:DNA-binding MarR family transcriptional regulator